jgi:hypothetical protein
MGDYGSEIPSWRKFNDIYQDADIEQLMNPDPVSSLIILDRPCPPYEGVGIQCLCKPCSRVFMGKQAWPSIHEADGPSFKSK